MKAILCTAHGPIENLSLADVSPPQPGPGEVLIDVTCVGLNFFDTLIIQNKYQVKPALPFSIGGEFAGRVAGLGQGVSGLTIGQRVAGYCSYGAAAEQITVPAKAISPIPEGLSDEKAAGLNITYGTSLHALKQRAKIQPGETLAVLGASGGVGIAAVEIGAILGAHVIACASSEEKITFAKSFGAHEGLDYSKQPLKETLKDMTHGKGVDVIYDPVGADLAEPALRALAWKGRFLVVGFAGGDIPKIPLNLTLLKGCDVLGVFWSDFVRREPEAHQDNMRDLFDWAASGKLSAHVHKVFEAHDFVEALNVIKKREAQGKVVLRMRS